MWNDKNGKKSMLDKVREGSGKEKPMYIYPTRGDVINDKKGGFYVVICLSKHAQTQQPLVTYKDLESGENHTLPLEMFTEDRFSIAFNISSLKEFLK